MSLSSIEPVASQPPVGGQTTSQQRYSLFSFPSEAQKLAQAVCSDWRIENALHWIVEGCCREDDSRVWAGHSAQNPAGYPPLRLESALAKDQLQGECPDQRIESRLG